MRNQSGQHSGNGRSAIQHAGRVVFLAIGQWLVGVADGWLSTGFEKDMAQVVDGIISGFVTMATIATIYSANFRAGPLNAMIAPLSSRKYLRLTIKVSPIAAISAGEMI